MKNKMKLVLSFLLVLSLVVGCSNKDNSEKTNTENGTKTTESLNVDKSEGNRIIKDMAGREVEVSKEIKKIGTLGSVGVLNTFVELMGDGDKIYNQMPSNFTKGDQWKMQYEFAPQIANGPLFESDGKEVLIEEILKSEVDVCFTMSKDIVKVLEENNIPCVYIEWEDTEDVKKAVELMGEVLGKKEIADKYITYFDEKILEANKLTKSLKEENKKTVLYGNTVEFSQPHIIAEWWIKEAGGKSVTDNGRTENTFEYTMEDLLQWNPEVMIVSNEKLVEEMKSNENYSGITAIKNDNVHVIPTVGHVWGNRTVEQPLTVMWTMHHLYPELMPRENLEKEIKYFYKEFFGYKISDEQVKEIIEK